jgi:hypothetical protein
MEHTLMAGRQTFADLTRKAIWIATFGEVAAAAAGVQAAATLSRVGSNKFSPYHKFSLYREIV